MQLVDGVATRYFVAEREGSRRTKDTGRPEAGLPGAPDRSYPVSLWIEPDEKHIRKFVYVSEIGPGTSFVMYQPMYTPAPGEPSPTPLPPVEFTQTIVTTNTVLITRPNDPSITLPTP